LTAPGPVEPSRVRGFIRRHWLFLSLIVAVPVVEYLAARGGAPGPAIALVRNPFAAIAAASVFCRYFIRDLRGPTRRWIVYLTPLTWVTALAIEGHAALPVLLWLDMLFGLGVLGVLGFAVAALRSTQSNERADYVGGLMDALLLPMGASMVSYGLWATFRLNPVYDPRVYAFEELLGVKVSLWSAQAYGVLTPLSALATSCYNLVAIAIAVVAAAQRDRAREQDVLNAILISGACGFALYFVCPVVGPVVSFGPYYPQTLPTVSFHPPLLMAVAGAPRNGMPSLHTIWALLIWFSANGVAVGVRRALRAFVLLTLWAVLSPEGSHWLIDVIVSVPLAVAIHAAFLPIGHEDPTRRRVTIGACGLLTAVWLLGLRSGILLDLPPAAAWMAVLGTVCWPLWRRHASDRSSRERKAALVPVGGVAHEWTLSRSGL
jgi:PAP2 superfamily